MSAELTIALPTYNRAALLEQQLSWLAMALKGHESRCEILISDNCSTDDTPAVIQRWRDAVVDGPLDVKVVRQPDNIGAVRNIAWCIRTASRPHVWTISDDDEIAPDAIGLVLDRLSRHPDLDLLLLNFSSRMDTGRRLFWRCFTVDRELVATPGRGLFERFLAYPYDSRWGGLALTTALVYRTEVARDALDHWPDGLENLMLQLFVTGYCAFHGTTMVTDRVVLDSIGGRAHFATSEHRHLAFRAVDVPAAMVKLAELGYSRRLVLRKLVQRPGAFVKLLPRSLMQEPRATVKALGRYTAVLGRGLVLASAGDRRRTGARP